MTLYTSYPSLFCSFAILREYVGIVCMTSDKQHQSRDDVNECMSPPSARLFDTVGSMESDNIFDGVSSVKETISVLNTCHHNVGFVSSQSTSPLNLHRSQSSGNTESGSDFDKFIAENEFLLNEEYSSSDLHHINHRRTDSNDSNLTVNGNCNRTEIQTESDNELEVALKEFDADLSQFPTEQDVYPSYS